MTATAVPQQAAGAAAAVLHGPVGRDEHAGRVDRLQQELARRGLDALVVARPQNVYYLTGFRSLGAGLATGMGLIHAALVPVSGPPVLFVRSLETKAAVHYSWTDVEPYPDYEDPYALIARRVRDARRVGVEHLELTVHQLGELARALPGTELVDVGPLVEQFRRVKSPAELVHVREASRIASLGLRTAIDGVSAGSRVADVVAVTARAMYEAGQDDISWPPLLLAAGPDGGRMHDTALDGVIQLGDVVTMEVTGSCHLYVAVAMASVCVGPPSPEVAAGYEVAVDLHQAARAAIRPSAAAAEIHAASDRASRAAGHGPYHRRVGGMVGINSQPSLFFEGLSLVKDEATRLEAGMTVLVQPGVDRPAMMVVASTNLVTDGGYEELTSPIVELDVR